MSGEPSLRVGVAELRRRPGNRAHVQRTLDLGGLAVSGSSVPAGAEAEVDLTLESLSDGVTVNGEVRVPWTGPCRRCLEETGGELVAEVHEVYSDDPLPGDDGISDLLAVDGDALELGPVVRDAVGLALPLAPLCRDACPGPDPESFPVRTGDPEKPADPRWAALSELRFDPEGDDG